MQVCLGKLKIYHSVATARSNHINCTREKVGPANESVKGLNTYTLGGTVFQTAVKVSLCVRSNLSHHTSMTDGNWVQLQQL